MTELEWKRLRRRLWSTAKKRAKRKGLSFTIKPEDLELPPDGLCPIFRIPLEKHKGKISPNTPTLDRISSLKGYDPGNVRVLSWRANYVKGEMTKEQIVNLLKYVENEGK